MVLKNNSPESDGNQHDQTDGTREQGTTQTTLLQQ